MGSLRPQVSYELDKNLTLNSKAEEVNSLTEISPAVLRETKTTKSKMRDATEYAKNFTRGNKCDNLRCVTDILFKKNIVSNPVAHHNDGHKRKDFILNSKALS